MNQAVLDDEEHKKRMLLHQTLYASFGKRSLASLIDVLVFIPIYLIAEYNYHSWKLLSLELFLMVFIPVVYKVIMEWKYGGTIGKLLMKLKVVDQELNSISFIQSLKRFSIYFLSDFFSVLSTLAIFNHPEFHQLSGDEMDFLFETEEYLIYLGIICFLFFLTISFILVTNKQQALHDLIAKTYCVNQSDWLNLQEIDELLDKE